MRATMKFLFLPLSVLFINPVLGADASLCHAFVDYDFIATLEVVRTRDAVTPIFNVVALASGDWEITPSQLQIVDDQGKSRKVETFSFDSGDPDNPFKAPYMEVRGGQFEGVDLVGDFADVARLSKVELDVGEDRLTLQPMDCNAFEKLVDQIGRLEIGSADMIAAFHVLNIPLLGERNPR